MTMKRRHPAYTLERERRRHRDAVRLVEAAMASGECEMETGLEAISVLWHWYEVTGMSIDRPLPAWLREHKET
jgi:hypothetical protein